jgi:hypothetical protein
MTERWEYKLVHAAYNGTHVTQLANEEGDSGGNWSPSCPG